MSRLKQRRHCLNCGAKLYEGNYCHICGQAATTGRLSTRNLGLHILAGVTRINKTFLRTVGNLLVHPWRVVADYIRGRRVAYVAPVQLLLVLAFIDLVVSSFLFGAGDDSRLSAAFGGVNLIGGTGVMVTFVNDLFRHLVTSTTWIFMLMLIPAIPVLRLTHRLVGVTKYNLAEYIVAALYFSCFILLVPLVAAPLTLLGDAVKTAVTSVELLYLLIMPAIAVYKSLSSSPKSPAVKIAALGLFLLLSVLTYVLLLLLVLALHVVTK